jgi:hypothetical protein
VTTERDVLGDRHRWYVAEMLMHHSDASRDRIRRRCYRAPCSGGGHDSTIWSSQPERNSHQRGFPGAVFSDERVNRSASDEKGHVVERDEIPKSLGDVAERKHHVGV